MDGVASRTQGPLSSTRSCRSCRTYLNTNGFRTCRQRQALIAGHFSITLLQIPELEAFICLQRLL